MWGGQKSFGRYRRRRCRKFLGAGAVEGEVRFCSTFLEGVDIGIPLLLPCLATASLLLRPEC